MARKNAQIRLAGALRDEQDRRGWSTATAGEFFGVSQQRFSDWARGDGRPSRSLVPRIAEFLRISERRAHELWLVSGQNASGRLTSRVAALEDEVAELRGAVTRLLALLPLERDGAPPPR